MVQIAIFDNEAEQVSVQGDDLHKGHNTHRNMPVVDIYDLSQQNRAVVYCQEIIIPLIWKRLLLLTSLFCWLDAALQFCG